MGCGEGAQEFRVLAALAEDQGSVPSTHVEVLVTPTHTDKRS